MKRRKHFISHFLEVTASWSLFGFSQNRLGFLQVRDLGLDSRARKYMNKCTYVRSQWRKHVDVPTAAWTATESLEENLPLTQTPYSAPCTEVPKGGTELTPPRRVALPGSPVKTVHACDPDPHPSSHEPPLRDTGVCFAWTSCLPPQFPALPYSGRLGPWLHAMYSVLWPVGRSCLFSTCSTDAPTGPGTWRPCLFWEWKEDQALNSGWEGPCRSLMMTMKLQHKGSWT